MRFLKALHRFSSSWTGTIVIVLFLIFFVVQSFVIPSGSMKRTLQVGDFLFAKKFVYGIPLPTLPWLEIPIVPDFNNNGHLIEGDRPKRGDIVIFRYPKNHKVHYVKRCVAQGGDELVYQDKHLYLHFVEGDEYIRQHYPKEKIVSFYGKLWVDNPYMDKFPGIQYVPENHENIFKMLLQNYMYDADEVDMSPVYVPSLAGELYRINGKPANALYKKVEQGHYYMMGWETIETTPMIAVFGGRYPMLRWWVSLGLSTSRGITKPRGFAGIGLEPLSKICSMNRHDIKPRSQR